jgi:hypothetical protein
MARQKIKSGDIAGYRYVVTQLGAIEGRKWADELGRAVIPAIVEVLSSLPEETKKKKVTIEDVIGAVGIQQARSGLDVILTGLPSARFDTLIGLLSENTDIYGPGFGDAGAPLARNFDDHFAGRYKAMFQWLAFALKVNFVDFFSERVGEIVTDPQMSTGRA